MQCTELKLRTVGDDVRGGSSLRLVGFENVVDSYSGAIEDELLVVLRDDLSASEEQCAGQGDMMRCRIRGECAR